MVSLNTVRTLSVRYESTGADKMRSDADAVAQSQDRAGRAATEAANATGQAAERSATVTETASKRQLSALRGYQTELLKVDAQARSQQQIERAMTRGGRAFDQGLITEQERDRFLGLAQARYAPNLNDNKPGAGGGGGLNTYDKLFVKYQATDFAQQVFAGTSPVTAAVQQGGQLFQQLSDREGGLTAGIKQLGVSAMGLITPFTLAATATVGTVAAFGLAAKQAADDRAMLERATSGIGRSTGVTGGQLELLAQRNVEPGKTSIGSAREMAASFAATGQIAVPVFDTLIQKGQDYAKLTGQDLPAAAAELARSFSAFGKGADDIAAKIGGLDDRTRQLIETQTLQGDKSGAQQTMAEYLRQTVEANTVATTGWAAAWNTATAAAGSYWEAAKRIAGIKLGVAPEGAEEALARLNKEIAQTDELRKFTGLQPLGIGTRQIRERDTAALIADTEAREARAKAAEERASQASRAAGDVSRAVDPNFARYRDLVKQQGDLRDALSDPLARGKLSDLGQVEDAYTATTRAINSMTDASGKLLSAEELSRRGDQLKIDALHAKTDAQKADIAAQQRAFDLIGKAVTPGDARGQVDRARQLSILEAANKTAGSSSDSKDEYDRALRSVEDRTRRQSEEIATYGMGAEAVARYRVETELLTAAKRAERDITPELTAQINSYSAKAADAAGQQVKMRDSMRDMDDLRSTSRSTFSSFASDLARGAGAGDALMSSLDRIKSKVLDIASTSIVDSLFGKTGSSSSGLLSELGSAAVKYAGYADGGLVHGPGGPREDRVLARLSPGEFVVNASAAARHMGVLHGINSGSIRGFADGGPVGGYGARPAMPVMPANGNAGPPNVTVINNGEPATATVTQQPDGSIDVILDRMEARMADRASRGRGPLSHMMPAGRRLRG